MWSLIRAIPQARNEFREAEEEDLDEIPREKAIVIATIPRHRSASPR